MLNPKKSKISKSDRSARTKKDPFASIVERCRVTHSAEETLGSCGFAGDDDSEELTQGEVHPIMMFTLPDTQSQAQTLPPISSGSGQNEACTTSTGVVPDKAADSGKVKDSSVPMDCEMAIPEVVDTSTDSETENYQFVKRGTASDNPNRSELPGAVRGSVKSQNVQESAIGDDQRPSKMAKFDSSNVLKEIAEHQKSSSAQNVQESSIGDNQRPSKMAKFDSLNVLKEIAEHRKSFSAQNVQEIAIGDDQPPSKKSKFDSLNVLKEIAEHQKSTSAQNVQNCAIGDDQRPSKKAKFDALSVLKEIVEHQKNSSSIPRSYGSLTFPRPRWWPEDYEDIV